MYRNNLALYTSYGGDFPKGEREAREVQKLNPNYAKGFIALAFGQLGQNQIPQALETYKGLEKVNPSYAASGFADLAIYEGRFAEAVRILEKAANADVAAKSLDRAADKFAALAGVELQRGQKVAAKAAASHALENSRSVSIRFLAARIFALTGEAEKARSLAAELAAEVPVEPQAYAKLIQGNLALENGDAPAAVTLFNQAKPLFDTWIGRFDLGRAYLAASAFVEADSEFDQCVKRRGEAMSLFLDEIPTYGYFPPVYFYKGRVQEELKNAAAAESFRTYLNIRGKAREDPLLADVRKRAGQ